MAEFIYIDSRGAITRTGTPSLVERTTIRRVSESSKRSSRNALRYEPIQPLGDLRFTHNNLKAFEVQYFYEGHAAICDYLERNPEFGGVFLVKITGEKPRIYLFARWEDIYPNIAVPPVILNARASALATQIPSYNTEHRPGRFEPVKRLKERNQCRRNTNRLNQTIRDAKWTVNSSRRLDTEVYDQLEEVCT